MTTARDIVNDAAFASTALGQGETLTDADAQLILRRFARLLDSWSNEDLLIYDIYVDDLPLTANVGDYSTTLLPHGRPVSVDSMYVVMDDISYPIEMIDNQRYNDIWLKTEIQSIPAYCWYDASYPDSTFHFWPYPYGGMVAKVNCRRLLQPTGMTLDTVLSFPAGYERMFVDNLGLDICPSFGITPPQALAVSAKEAKANLKRTNYVALEANTGLADFSSPYWYPLFKGW